MAMTPRELAKLQKAKFQKMKFQRENGAPNWGKADRAANREHFKEQSRVASEALENLLPFLNEVRAAMETMDFEFSTRKYDGKTTGIAMRLSDAAASIRKDSRGNIRAKICHRNSGGERTYNHIRTVTDLTNDKISDLIQSLIMARQR